MEPFVVSSKLSQILFKLSNFAPTPTPTPSQHQELLPSPLQLKDETMRKKRERLCFISPL
jgi:hypothetical protein